MKAEGINAEVLLVEEWRTINERLVQLRAQKREIASAIKDLVEVRKNKARLIRVIDPSLLKRFDEDDD